jgi:methyl-accepting chemotaxis protein
MIPLFKPLRIITTSSSILVNDDIQSVIELTKEQARDIEHIRLEISSVTNDLSRTSSLADQVTSDSKKLNQQSSSLDKIIAYFSFQPS